MLIHKATMGAIAYIWTGEIVKGIPVGKEAHLKDYPWLDRQEWWDISVKSELGKRICDLYPDCVPKTDETGNLVAVEATGIPAEKEDRTAALKEEAANRGYKQAGRVRRLGMMPFLGGHGTQKR